MKVYGIDLGTTNSCISIMESGQERVIENDEGNNVTPSVVAIKNGEWIVGAAAKRQQEVNPNTCVSIKRLMGTNNTVNLEGKDYKPEFISAKILDYLVKNANKKMNENIKNVVITVPAYFDDSQRNATKLAGEIAGLNVMRVLNEPTAGAIAYKIDNNDAKKIMAFDLGGGTFDISILEVTGSDYEVIATAGDNKLGGDNWDDIIIDRIKKYCVEELKLEKSFIDLKSTEMRFKVAAEGAKINLSQMNEVEINIPFISMNENGPLHINFKLTKQEFENDSQELLKKVKKVFEDIIADSKLPIKSIDKVILIGGSTRMPMIVELLKSLAEESKINHGLNVDESVSIGAAIYGDSVFNKDSKNEIMLMDVTSRSFGTALDRDVFDILIPKNTTIPVSVSKKYTTVSDFQELIEIEILQGENPVASMNNLIAKFDLKDIQYAAKGVPLIETTFKIDADGILHVSSRDLSTGSEKGLSIKNALQISEKDKEQLKLEFKE
ncbi:Hsp70 family protein [Spiroplasma sp. BIUS-1]|uniref:Hsp70 family protein n=1 Tax=Spiroplasma sp. BIUS-1 TaxID=216964 RepID=UPI001398FCEC|nr:Hsp70 family protein [Spiroplasma sp. BIUS-1]QHX36762.1 molecular chaperone DnaK [Spiroplasma sp. BIUS-1]